MIVNGSIEKIEGNKITLISNELPDVRKITKYANGKQPSASIDIEDGRTISPAQRNKVFAMLTDMSNSIGYTQVDLEDLMKFRYMVEYQTDSFSLSNCSMTVATKFIHVILDFCFENNIGFRTKTWDLISNDYYAAYKCLQYRKCVVCGKHADIAHYEAVGMGRNRNKIDHSQFHFMALCRVHHTEQHKIGILTFCKKYQIKPVKLDLEDRKKLHIGG